MREDLMDLFHENQGGGNFVVARKLVLNGETG